jgi:hypothetical protein
MNRPDYQKKMIALRDLLLKVANQPEKISLPFPIKDRHKHLAERLYSMYGHGYLETDPDMIFYTIEYGATEKTPVFPFAFELIAVPLDIDSIRKDPSFKESEFHVLVNSSYAALGARFDGSYFWTPKKSGKYFMDHDIIGCLSKSGFVFSTSARKSTNKIPCVFVGNLMSQRVDYTEKSKAKMDASPFIPTIIKAVQRLAS